MLLFKSVCPHVNGSVILHIRIFKCIDGMPTNILFWYTGLTFLIGYLIPLFIFVIINVCVIENCGKFFEYLF